MKYGMERANVKNYRFVTSHRLIVASMVTSSRTRIYRYGKDENPVRCHRVACKCLIMRLERVAALINIDAEVDRGGGVVVMVEGTN